LNTVWGLLCFPYAYDRLFTDESQAPSKQMFYDRFGVIGDACRLEAHRSDQIQSGPLPS
jgi:hypothetical protein